MSSAGTVSIHPILCRNGHIGCGKKSMISVIIICFLFSLYAIDMSCKLTLIVNRKIT
ncbi:hypothetical protein M6B38_349690 [Iris pallida]|uniref:Uncharacterized protein n=1 Tax=Iris pallida TaxID=29817 RepID=A0AAX6GS61_IRIPA|nr:hypothetical protein M6B38_349690 [Iris pallida]